jgi:hypothetical protein
MDTNKGTKREWAAAMVGGVREEAADTCISNVQHRTGLSEVGESGVSRELERRGEKRMGKKREAEKSGSVEK